MQSSNASVKIVWEEQNDWSYTSGLLKRNQDRTRNLAILFGLLGAALGTVAGLKLGIDKTVISALGILSAISIIIAGIIGRELLTFDRETEWTRCRTLSEALQREVWLYLMKVPPYDNDPEGSALRAKAAKLLQNTGLTKEYRSSRPDDKPVPEVTGLDSYKEFRLKDQIEYYEKACKRHQRPLRLWKLISLALTIAAACFGIAAAEATVLPSFIPLAMSALAAVTTHLQARRFNSLISLYQETAIQLKFKLAQLEDSKSGDTSGFVQSCEEIMAQENQSWRAEWLSKEAMEKQQEAFDKIKGE